MLASEHTQSLLEFQERAAEIIDRLNQTGEAEFLTVNGEARAVLLSPAVYDAMTRESEIIRDVAAIGRATTDIAQGRGEHAGKFFANLRSELRNKQAAERKDNET